MTIHDFTQNTQLPRLFIDELNSVLAAKYLTRMHAPEYKAYN